MSGNVRYSALPSDDVGIQGGQARRGEEAERPKSEEEKASFLGKLLFSWVTPMVNLGYKQTLELEDLINITKADTSSVLTKRFQKAWAKELALSKTWNDQIGQRVTDDAGKGGTLRWLGRLPYSANPSDWYAGVDWDDVRRQEKQTKPGKPYQGVGGDGWFYGEKYFDCKQGHGSFIRPHLLKAASGKVAPKTPWVTWGLKGAFMKEIVLAGCYKLGNDVTIFAGPLALQAIITYLSDLKKWNDGDHGGSKPELQTGLLIVAILFVAQVIQSLCVNQYFYEAARVGMRLRQSLSGAIFDKSLHLNERTRSHPDMNTGRIVNMMSTDAQRASDVMLQLHTLWSAPLQIVVSTIFLYRLVGVALFAGLGVMTLTSPLQGKLMAKMMRAREAMAKFTDERIKAVNEVFSGIRVIKFMAWDRRSEEQLREIRDREVDKLASQQNYRVLMFTIIYTTPMMLTATTFIVYSLMGYTIKPSVIFPAMSLFTILRFPFLMLPMQMNMMINAKVSFDRLTLFLEAPDRSEAGTIPQALSADDAANDVALRVKGSFHAYEPQVLPAIEERAVQLAPPPSQETAVSPAHTPAGGAGGGGGAKKKMELKRYKIVPKPVLHDVDVAVRRNKLLMIVGATGSGKTCLVEAMLGNVDGPAGCAVHLPGSVDPKTGKFEAAPVGYSPQQAWIMNATLRNNIIFYKDEDEDKYREVVEQCQLAADLEQLADGEHTEIGEKGVNLSGGQKQRVSIARAIYAEAGVTVLDDPLSAVDPHVGLSLMKLVIGASEHTRPADWPAAALDQRTRVLVTHNIQFARYADDVIFMKDGKVQAHFCGSAEDPVLEQMRTYDGEGSDFFEPLQQEEESPSAEPLEKKVASADDEAAAGTVVPSKSPTPATTPKAEDKGKLVKEEERAQGSVKMHMYVSYIKQAGGWLWLSFALVLFIITQACMQACDLWLTWWSDSNDPADAHRDDAIAAKLTRDEHVYVYAGLIVFAMFIILLRGFISYARFQSASRTFHQALVKSVLNAPMSFFDTTPLGRLINRFSRDIDQIDVVLPPTVITFFSMIISVSAYVIVIATSQKIMLTLLVPGGVLYYFILKRFIRCNRETKRLDSVHKSPMFQHFTETLSGITSIASFGRQAEFVAENRRRIDTNTRTTFANLACNRWLAIRLELLGNIIACATALFAVLSPNLGLGGSIGMLSLGITYSLTLTSQLSWLVRQVADLEAQMNGVERIVEFTEEIDQEPSLRYDSDDKAARGHYRGQQYLDTNTNELLLVKSVQQNTATDGQITLYSTYKDESTTVTTQNYEVPGLKSSTKAPGKNSWPSSGASDIVFTDVLFRYRQGLPLVLKGLGGPSGLKINGGDRIGVVGRTGAGKSTVMLALFRLVEVAGGSITIGGRDLRTLKLNDLRSAISMIPQDPVLFQGTVRSNLDPFNLSTDGEIWKRLEQVNLKQRVQEHDGELEGSVTQGGANFSVGQRQLLCMARALLKQNSRIVLMDEATASIDHATDAAIQHTIREQFSGYTVLTVAHRLQTIMDSTKIMVLDQGVCAEYDTPANLMNDPDSIFHSMAQKTGNFEHLKAVANGEVSLFEALAAQAPVNSTDAE